MTVKSIGFVFSLVNQIEYSGKPQIKNVINTIDLSSDILSIKRLSGESTVDFKNRVLDVSVHLGGPEYFGVINNLTRDFGFLREPAMTIELVLDINNIPLARNPRVDILANRIVLYSDWRTDGTAVVDREIRFYSPNDEGYFLSDLIASINLSTCFTASITSGVRPNLHSSNLVRMSSDYVVALDHIRADKRTVLIGQNIIEDSIVFPEPTIFSTLVTSTPSTAGEYKLDRTAGTIEVFSIPSGEYGITYHAGRFPLEIDYSPIKVYTLNDEDFVSELFIHETLDSGEEVNSLPNVEGSEIIHQVFKETEVFWGK